MEELLAAELDQAGCVSISASQSRGADAGASHQQEAEQQEQAELSVLIECYQSSLWLWGQKKHGPVLKEVIVSFRRRPLEEPNRTFQVHSLSQQPSGLQDREQQNQGQGSLLRPGPKAFGDTCGQDNKGSPSGPTEGPSCPTDEGTRTSGRLEGSQDKEFPLNEDHGGEGSTAIVTPAAHEEPSWVGDQAAAGPDPDQAHIIPFSAFLEALAEGSQMCRRKVLSILEKVLIAAQDKGEQKKQHPTGGKDVLTNPAQSIRAEHLGRVQPVKQGPGQQLVEPKPDLELNMKEAAETGTPAEPAFRSPSPTVIDVLAQERRTSIFKSAPRALPRASTAMHSRGKQEQQQPTPCAQELMDTAQYISSEVLSKSRTVIQGLKQKEEQDYWEHSTDATLAVRARAAGAVSPAHAPHNPTADVLALLDTAPYTTDEILSRAMIVIHKSEEYTEEQRDWEQGTGEGMTAIAPEGWAESPGHTIHSHTADAPVFLDHNDYLRTEVVKKAVLMVQKPSEYSEEEQDRELIADRLKMVQRPSGHVQSIPAPAVINTQARQRWLRLVHKAMRALPLASTATSATGKEKKQLTADGMDLLDTAECIRRDVPDKATLEIQRPGQQIVEQQDMKPRRDVSPTVTATAAGKKSHVHETCSPTADGLVFLNAADCIHTEVVKKALRVTQRHLEETEEPWEQEQGVDEEMGAKARTVEAGGQTHFPHSPRADDQVLLDTAQHIPAPGEGTESPGHTLHSCPAGPPVFLDYNDYLRTEAVKKAVLMVQKPFEYPEEEQDQELTAERSKTAKNLWNVPKAFQYLQSSTPGLDTDG
ncbi:uncharacterized protein LOC111940831 [Cyanistes caeruleus]|uniref:uncharacterized protein LOC111940831 n=1 Tax=Cyanistes caeruleus TaxID=156563 RepID=UPI000CDB42CB|nr:uncharacterized protein LOC111940831 [Cyanistes caeruleus]